MISISWSSGPRVIMLFWSYINNSHLFWFFLREQYSYSLNHTVTFLRIGLMQYPYPVTSISIKKIKNYQIKKPKRMSRVLNTQPQFSFLYSTWWVWFPKLETCSPASRMWIGRAGICMLSFLGHHYLHHHIHYHYGPLIGAHILFQNIVLWIMIRD